MLRISNHTACRFVEKHDFSSLSLGRAALRPPRVLPFSKVKRSVTKTHALKSSPRQRQNMRATGGRRHRRRSLRPDDREQSDERFLKGEGEFEGERETFFRKKKFPSPPQHIPSKTLLPAAARRTSRHRERAGRGGCRKARERPAAPQRGCVPERATGAPAGRCDAPADECGS